MRLELDMVLPRGIDDALRVATRAEELGVHGVWTREQGADPFISLAPVALATRRILIGTNVAVAFGRSPYVTAVLAWQLQAAARDRFVLGLGSQVKAHVQWRYGMPFEAPGQRLREYVRAVRAVWGALDTGEIDFDGRFYQFRGSVFTAYFRPAEPVPTRPPIMISAVNPYNCRTVGLICDGIMIHPLHSMTVLREVVMTNVRDGLAESGRQRADISAVCPVLVAVGRDDQELDRALARVRRTIAFYGSTRSYRAVFDSIGHPGLADRLHGLMRTGELAEATSLVTEDIVAELAVVCRPSELADRLVRRYQGVVDRVHVSNPEDNPALFDDSSALASFAAAFPDGALGGGRADPAPDRGEG